MVMFRHRIGIDLKKILRNSKPRMFYSSKNGFDSCSYTSYNMSRFRQIIPRNNKKGLYDVTEIEEWARIPYIESGYRCCNSYNECIKTMISMIHNESFNAWSMIICLFLSYNVAFDIISKHNMVLVDRIPIYVLLFAITFHSPISFCYHSFRVISHEVMHKWRAADMSALMLVNVFCTYAASYYTLTIPNTLVALSISSFFALCGVKDIFKSLNEIDISNKSNIVKRFFMSSLPYYVLLLGRGYIASFQSPEMMFAISIISLQFIGGMFYISHWPQRQFPRIFDSLGCSHNLMHIFCCSTQLIGLKYLELLYSKQKEWVLI